ncbi:hypothetical protein A2160_00270 [Candidatus Beckwithbacteria bacterium RBG_13_42_9]|uniref:Uncharacterized protein n=1 Tax=Candidatus Beckwithbacteria bacterium RBG_13_42_9 TaxID=1797457 RepID=A0A1F5E557_9BACT|nr:MAG: hypothetical protein A2160_00270 [Candidatus Beckwithbacteria bacterium RBG_13_42_9]
MNTRKSQLNQQTTVVKRRKLALGCSDKLLIEHKTMPIAKREIVALPVVETNLKQEDLEILSVKLGEEIAAVVIDEILSIQSPNIRAIVGK